MTPNALQQAFNLGCRAQRLDDEWYSGEYPYTLEDFELEVQAIHKALQDLMFQSLFSEVPNAHQ